MIRIKCPKCATPISLDDDEAGQVGLCQECGAKFRVPAAKAAGSQPGRGAEESRRAARDEDEDEEEEDLEDEEQDEDEDEPVKGKGKKKGGFELGPKAILTGVGILLVIIALGVGGIYINRLAIIVTFVSFLLLEACALMVARSALSDSTAKFLMVWWIPLYFFYYAIENWEETHSYISAYVAFLLMTLVGAGSIYLNMEHVDAKRKATRDRIGQATPAIVRAFHDV